VTADEPSQPEPNVVPQQQIVWAPSTPPSAPVSTYVQPLQQQYGPGPIGKVRGTGVCILLSVVTPGIYNIVWYYQTRCVSPRRPARLVRADQRRVERLLAFARRPLTPLPTDSAAH